MVNLDVHLHIRRHPCKFMNVMMWERCTFDSKIFDVAKFTTPLSLLILCKLSSQSLVDSDHFLVKTVIKQKLITTPRTGTRDKKRWHSNNLINEAKLRQYISNLQCKSRRN
jgi:hypothetical protein